MSVRYVVSSKLPTEWGVFDIHGFEDQATGKEHIALTFGDVSKSQPVLARVHSECLTGDALFSQRCDCGSQLKAAMAQIAEEGHGVILYLRQEGRGIGLINKIKAYQLQDEGADTVEANEQLGFGADQREYAMCDVMLKHLKIKKIKLLTNNPRKVASLEGHGYEIVERIPLHTGRNPHNQRYLETKQDKLGHMMNSADDKVDKDKE